jgi:predicted transcriptional regulator
LPRRTYRSKLEVFRDVLVATRQASRKTRIIGLANLNPTSFQRHMALARAHGFVLVDDGDYRLTDKADRFLAALDEVMAKSLQLDEAVRSLEQSALAASPDQRRDGVVLRYISRLAWSEVQRPGNGSMPSFSRAGGVSANPNGSPDRTRDLSEILSSLPRMPQSNLAALTDPRTADRNRLSTASRPAPSTRLE